MVGVDGAPRVGTGGEVLEKRGGAGREGGGCCGGRGGGRGAAFLSAPHA